MYHDKEASQQGHYEEWQKKQFQQAQVQVGQLNTSGIKPAPPTTAACEMSPIDRQLDSLDHAIGGAHDRFDILSNRLRSVLKNDCEKEGGIAGIPSLCPIHDRLSQSTYRIQILEERMVSIIERLCI